MLKFFRIPFANGGDKTPIPDDTDPSGNVSFEQGYGPDYQRQKTDPASKNIERDKMNSLFNEVTVAVGELQEHGVADFITSALNGGTPFAYSTGSLVRYSPDGIAPYQIWENVAANNVTTPSEANGWRLIGSTKAIFPQVRFTTTANITLSGLATQAGGDWAGALIAGDRILVQKQTVGAENGWYVASAGAWVRASDANTTGQVLSGVLCVAQEGVTLSGSLWMLTTNDPITIGTTALTFTKQGGSAALVNIVRYATAGSGTYTKPSNVSKLRIRCIGGGGGGAGDYGDFGSGGGGGAGGYCEKFITSPSGSYAYVVGAAGVAGAASGGVGGTGGNTTIAGMTAGGGGPGYGSVGAGGVGGTASSGDLNVPGDGGASGGVKGGSSANSGGGKGGSGPWGGGGKGGGNGGGYSGTAGSIGGGGGGAGLGGAAAPGGAGYIEIEEYA
jgi:hypothetical protein